PKSSPFFFFFSKCLPDSNISKSSRELEIGAHKVRVLDETIITPNIASYNAGNVYMDTTEYLNSIYVYNEKDTVYASTDQGKHFFKMFIFNAKAGYVLNLERNVLVNEKFVEYELQIDSVIETENHLKKYKCRFDGVNDQWQMDKIGGIGANSYLWPLPGIPTEGSSSLFSYTEGNVTYDKDGKPLTAHVEEAKNNFVSIYPNPIVNTLNISTDKKIEKAEVFNGNGDLLLTTHQKEIDFSSFSNGIYFVNILFDDNSKVVQKVIK
ncbi:MAG TPA: T9SS type A sorting domain-containing protein, partial [Paludibacteraceae bacterium]|nr:T9SS type A sorting domain-containing protein [Paludibacteraceae bacterium]